jgi:hypothetical protein
MEIIAFVSKREGRFLVSNETGDWTEAGPEVIRKKVMQSLRDRKNEPAGVSALRTDGESPSATVAESHRIRKPKPTDFLLGRGGKQLRVFLATASLESKLNGPLTQRLAGVTNNHPGNKRFRSMAEKQKQRYASSRNDEKKDIARCLVKRWNGRFLRKEDGADSWYVVSENEATSAVQQLLVRKDSSHNARGTEEGEEVKSADLAAVDGAAALVEMVLTEQHARITKASEPATTVAEHGLLTSSEARAERMAVAPHDWLLQLNTEAESSAAAKIPIASSETLPDAAAADAVDALFRLGDGPCGSSRFVSNDYMNV